MKTLLALISGFVVAAPAHAVSIVSLHSGMGTMMVSTAVDAITLIISVGLLTAAIAYRAFRRKAARPHRSSHP